MARCPSTYRPVNPAPSATATRSGARSARVATAAAVTIGWRRLGTSTAGPSPMTCVRSAQRARRHPHVVVQRGRVVQPRPLVAELLGERDVVGGVPPGREGGGQRERHRAGTVPGARSGSRAAGRLHPWRVTTARRWATRLRAPIHREARHPGDELPLRGPRAWPSEPHPGDRVRAARARGQRRAGRDGAERAPSRTRPRCTACCAGSSRSGLELVEVRRFPSPPPAAPTATRPARRAAAQAPGRWGWRRPPPGSRGRGPCGAGRGAAPARRR